MLRSQGENPVAVSARSGSGLSDLLRAVDEQLARRRRTVDVTVPFDQGEVLSRIHDSGRVLSEEYGPEGVRVRAELDRPEADRLMRILVGEDQSG